MWNKEEINFLTKKFSSLSDSELSNILGKTVKSIQSKARRLKLKKDPTYIGKINKDRVESRWSDKIWAKNDINFLVTNINILTNNELSNILNRSLNSIQSMINKLELKRDKKYNKEFLEKECLKYITKQELRICDPNLYAWLYKNGKMVDFSKHMMNISYSTPQLILKYMIKELTSKKFNYNDRNAIKPYEIDIYFPEQKIGIEYDGIYFHPKSSSFKRQLCESKGIKLITIDENSLTKKNFIEYVKNIKNQLIKNIDTIRQIDNIEELDIRNLIIDSKKVFGNLIDIDNLKSICNKYDDYSEFIKREKKSYNKLYYMGLLYEFTKHMTVKSDESVELKNILERKEFYKVGDKILIEYWYNGMITCVMIENIIGRTFKVTHKIPESRIFNAPDENIKSSDIIDYYKN
jgi:very-short-patch-repair endonuclease